MILKGGLCPVYRLEIWKGSKRPDDDFVKLYRVARFLSGAEGCIPVEFYKISIKPNRVAHLQGVVIVFFQSSIAYS